MPALSKKQQKFFGIVRAIQKGEQTPTTPETAKAAADMKKSDVKKFASTKHKGLPEKKVTKEELDKNDKPFVKKLVGKLRKGSKTHAKQADDLEKAMNEESNPRIPRKPGQPAGSKKHSDLYTDENPKGTIHGLGFKDVATAKASVSKIRNSSRSHAHKIQAAVAMEQRAREMGKTSEAAVYRKFINTMKKKTKKMNEAKIDTVRGSDVAAKINDRNQRAFGNRRDSKGSMARTDDMEKRRYNTEKGRGVKTKGMKDKSPVDYHERDRKKRIADLFASMRKEEVKRDEYGDPIGGPKISKKQKEKNLKANTPDEQHTTTTSEAANPAQQAAIAINMKKKGKKPKDMSEEGLRDWFGKSSGTTKSGRRVRGWVQVGGKYDGKPCARQPGQKTTPKCVSSSKRRSMSKDERDSARRRKVAADPGQPQKTGAAKPTMVSTDPKKKMKENVSFAEAKDKKGKGSGTKDACYHKVKSRYSVWPSAYASGALVKCRKVGAANWGNSTKEEFVKDGISFQQFQEKCWKGYEKKGMKTMFGKRYPNCVKKEETEVVSEVSDKLKKSYIKGATKEIDDLRKTKMTPMGMDSQASDKVLKRKINIGKTMSKLKEDDMKGMSVKSGHKRPTKSGAGMTKKGVEAYRRRNPGSKLKTAVTTPPSKLKPGSKSANRRKSYCARSAGQMKKFPKAAKDPNSRLRQARRRWNC